MREKGDNVVPFAPKHNDVVEILDHLRERARRGEIAGLAVASISSDMQIFHRVAGYTGFKGVIMRGLLLELHDEVKDLNVTQ